MLEWLVGAAAAGGAVVLSAQAANRVARKVSRSARDLAALVEDTIEGGTMLAARCRREGVNLCAASGSHTHPSRVGSVDDDDIEHMRCLDCGATWEQSHERDWD
jgi:hypothetical protein